MPFFDAMYAPYRKGDRVTVLAHPDHKDKHGSIFVVQPENAFNGEDAVYWVLFDGETQECPEAFSYWQLALEETHHANK